MKIAILGGTGPEGSGLGLRWAQAGHLCVIGARDPKSDKVIDLIQGNNGVSATEVKHCVRGAGAILVATPPDAIPGIAEEIGDVSNSIIIDTTSNTITIESAQDIQLKAPSGKISLEATELEFKANANAKLEAGANMDLKANGNATLKGAMVMIN